MVTLSLFLTLALICIYGVWCNMPTKKQAVYVFQNTNTPEITFTKQEFYAMLDQGEVVDRARWQLVKLV